MGVLADKRDLAARSDNESPAAAKADVEKGRYKAETVRHVFGSGVLIEF